ncbi:helix-turn-helix domain-containing protein, partial [Vibrio parahaemolyticus]|nr:helix-turn-helix domain-containing protein [Vibrio parahaemolyticus]
VCIKTINQGLTFSYSSKDDDMQNMVTDIQITMLTAMAAAERKNRLASAEAGRQALKANPTKWAEKFQGRKPNTKQHQRIIELLLEGKSIRGVAQELGCNASTVQRVKKKAVEAGTVF